MTCVSFRQERLRQAQSEFRGICQLGRGLEHVLFVLAITILYNLTIANIRMVRMQAFHIVKHTCNREIQEVDNFALACFVPSVRDIVGVIPYGDHQSAFRSFMESYVEAHKHLYEKHGYDEKNNRFWMRNLSNTVLVHFHLELLADSGTAS